MHVSLVHLPWSRDYAVLCEYQRRHTLDLIQAPIRIAGITFFFAQCCLMVTQREKGISTKNVKAYLQKFA